MLGYPPWSATTRRQAQKTKAFCYDPYDKVAVEQWVASHTTDDLRVGFAAAAIKKLETPYTKFVPRAKTPSPNWKPELGTTLLASPAFTPQAQHHGAGGHHTGREPGRITPGASTRSEVAR